MAWRLAAAIVLPFAAAYFLSLFFRTINAVIAPDLVAELRLSPTDLGFLTATYFLSFALFQIPLGILLDRFGARRVQTGMVLIAALGALAFALGQSLTMLAIGRALIGLGFAGGLMSAYKLIADWFPKERLPVLNGCFMGVGSMGALVATAPAQWIVDGIGWRGLLLAAAAITAVVALSIVAIVPERPRVGERPARLAQQVGELGRIYGDRLFWRVAPLTIACFATGTSIQGLWAAPWLRDIAALDRGAVSEQLLYMALALSVGSAVGGLAAEALQRRGVSVLAVAGGAAVAFMIAEAGIILELTGAATLLWVLFGGTFNVVTLTYSALSQHFGSALAGRANTGMNVLSVGGAFACQFGIGAIINLWPVAPSGAYHPTAYQVAFGLALAVQAAALLWFLLFRPRVSP